MRSVIRSTVIGCAVGLFALTMFLTGCGTERTDVDPSEKVSLFPLSLNNFWKYAVHKPDEVEAFDTVIVRLDSLVQLEDGNYYHLSINAPTSVWITQDENGDFAWTDEPGNPTHPFFPKDAEVGTPWDSELGDCQSSRLLDADTTLDVPMGRFWKTRMIEIKCDVVDGGVLLGLAPGGGPVFWQIMGFAQHSWLLVESIALDDYSAVAVPEKKVLSP